MKKWILKIPLLYVLFLWENPDAATLHKHALGLRLGWSYLQNRDALGSPFRYSGGIKAFGLMYRYHGSSEHMARINVAFGSLKPQSKTFEKSANYFSGDVQYSYFRPWSRFQNIKWGGVWNTVGAARLYDYSPNSDNVSPVYHFFSSLDAAVLYEREFYKRDRFYVVTYLPLLVYVTRSPYVLLDNRIFRAIVNEDSLVLTMITGGRITSLHRFVNANFLLGYERLFGRRLALNILYHGIYHRYVYPVKTTTLDQRVSVDFTVAF